jgi:hypothetical protein
MGRGWGVAVVVVYQQKLGLAELTEGRLLGAAIALTGDKQASRACAKPPTLIYILIRLSAERLLRGNCSSWVPL